MRVRAKSNFKVGRWCAEPDRVYDIPERAAYVVDYGWAAEIPADAVLSEPVTVITADMISPEAPKPPAADVTLQVENVTHAAGISTEGQ
ncbi:hypothetical protein [Microcystis phage Mae-JY22]